MKTSLPPFRLISAIALMLQCVALPALAQTVTATPTVSDPNLVACGTSGVCAGHGSKLAAGDSVVITAPVASTMTLPHNTPAAPAHTLMSVGQIAKNYSSEMTNAVCYSIKNNTNNTYFVPWNTPLEWSAFLQAIQAPSQLTGGASLSGIMASIGQCCPPTPPNAPLTLMDATGHACTDSSGNPMYAYVKGTRYVGTTPQDIPYYGANGDHTGLIPATEVSTNPDLANLDYMVQFECENGSWVQQIGQGNCEPTSGECSASSSSIASVPADLSTLCAPGSVFGAFTNTGGASSPGPWAWTCLGTPGQPSASCSSDGTPGACGTANNQPAATIPVANLCANGTTPSAVSGPSLGANPLYTWTCSGVGSSTVTTSCSAPAAAACGSAAWASQAQAPDPATDNLCTYGTPSAITYGSSNYMFWSAAWQTPGWSWSCNAGGGNVNCSAIDSNAPQTGQCGDTAGQPAYDSATIPPSGQLCQPNSTSSTPVFVLGYPTSEWAWTCTGNNGGTVAQCGVTYDPAPGVCGNAQGAYFGTPPTSGLCQSGTPSVATDPWDPTTLTGWWGWTCEGSLGEQVTCWANLYANGECGDANGVATSEIPVDLCATGVPTAVTTSGNSWSWACQSEGGGNITTSCTAPNTGNIVLGTLCGPANGTSSSSIPSANLCIGGSTASSVVDTGNGQWTWTCDSGTKSNNCVATNTGTAAGACGATNGTSSSTAPSVNLCSSGGPSAVTGSGPWQWSCLGEGTNLGQNAYCSANLCQVCSGSVTLNGSSATVSGTMYGCAVQGYASWTEIDSLGAANDDQKLQWNDPLHGTFSTVLNYAAASSTYCPPCYQTVQSVSNAEVVVQKVSGSCSDPTLNAGGSVSYPASNITLTPQ